MKIAATIALLAGSASAFTPMPSTKASTAISASLDGLPGALAPAGVFDPLGLAEKATDATLKRYREAELTHGRVAMLATVGFLAGEKEAWCRACSAQEVEDARHIMTRCGCEAYRTIRRRWYGKVVEKAKELSVALEASFVAVVANLRVLLLGLLRLKVLVKWVITATYPEIRVNKY